MEYEFAENKLKRRRSKNLGENKKERNSSNRSKATRKHTRKGETKNMFDKNKIQK